MMHAQLPLPSGEGRGEGSRKGYAGTRNDLLPTYRSLALLGFPHPNPLPEGEEAA